MQHRPIGAVAKSDVAKFHFSADLWQLLRVWLIHQVNRHIQNLEDTLGSHAGTL